MGRVEAEVRGSGRDEAARRSTYPATTCFFGTAPGWHFQNPYDSKKCLRPRIGAAEKKESVAQTAQINILVKAWQWSEIVATLSSTLLCGCKPASSLASAFLMCSHVKAVRKTSCPRCSTCVKVMCIRTSLLRQTRMLLHGEKTELILLEGDGGCWCPSPDNSGEQGTEQLCSWVWM